MGKKKQGDMPITHGQAKPKNKGGRPRKTAEPSGPQKVQASIEAVIATASKRYKKGGSDKALSDLAKLTESYCQLVKMNGPAQTLPAQSIGEVFQDGMKGAYEEIVAAHSAEAEETDVAPTAAAADPATVQDTEEAEG